MELERERKELVAAVLHEGEDDRRLHERLQSLRGALDELEQAIVDGAGRSGRRGDPDRSTQ